MCPLICGVTTLISCSPQHAIAVIEGPPIKKVKSEQLESGPNVRQLVSGTSRETASTPVASRSSQKGLPKTSRVKATKNNLPPLMKNDPEDEWSKNVLPSIVLWYGDQANVWSVKETDLERVLVAVIGVVYPSFDDLDEMKQGGHIYELVRILSVICIVSVILMTWTYTSWDRSGSSAPQSLAKCHWECGRARSAQVPE